MSFSMAARRLLGEYKQITENPPEGMTAGPVNEDNLFEWECLVLGPEGTPYEGGCFHAILSFPRDYPMNPPKMKFTTPVWHPNIHEDGPYRTLKVWQSTVKINSNPIVEKNPF